MPSNIKKKTYCMQRTRDKNALDKNMSIKPYLQNDSYREFYSY